MTTQVAFTLQIKGFCNRKRYIEEVKEALISTLDDVKVLEMDPSIGKFIILTTIATCSDAITCVIKRTFPKNKIILSPGINHNLPQFQTSAKTIALQIHQFCYCDGCIKKVNKALKVLNDVKLLAKDPTMGLFVILTTKHPNAVKRAINCPFPKKKITCVRIQDAPSPPPPPQTNITPSAPPIPQIQIWYGDTLQGTVSGFFEDDRLTIYDI